jgi:predicted MFS family arabinose efflux permease
MFGVFLFLTYYLQQERGYSALLTGVAFLPYAGAIVVGAAICSRLLPRFGLRYAMAGGLLLASLGMLLLTRIGLQTSYSSVVLPAELVVGLGLGLTFGPLASVALIGVAVRDFGVAGAMVNTAQQLGGSLGTALLNTIATSAVTSYLTDHSASVGVLAAAAVHSYALVFAVSAALLGGATLSALLLIRVPHGQLG